MWKLMGGIVGVFLFKGVEMLPSSILMGLLYPYAWVCKIFYNMGFIYEEGTGYVSSLGSFVISKACLGNTFMCMVFCLLYFTFLKCFKHKGWWLLVCFVGAIFIGYVINSIRILASIPYLGGHYFALIHSMIGMVVFLGSLILIYRVTGWLLEKEGIL